MTDTHGLKNTYTHYLDIAKEVGRAASEQVRAFAAEEQSTQEVIAKAVGDYVTACDLAVEERITTLLMTATPDIPVFGEEKGGVWSECMWVVDPIDGTTNFTRRFPMVGVSIALMVEGSPVVGVVQAPLIDRSWYGATGLGAFNDAGHQLSVRKPGPGLVVTTGFPFRNRERLTEYLPVFHHVLEWSEDIRRPGAASLDCAYTAQGSHDGYFELNLGTWDIAAGAVLIREAGGVVTDWDGDEKDVFRSGDILAGSPECHQRLLACVQSQREKLHMKEAE